MSQHDAEVARLVASRDVVADSAKVVIRRVTGGRTNPDALDKACCSLVGLTYFWLMTGQPPDRLDLNAEAARFLRAGRGGEPGACLTPQPRPPGGTQA